MVLLHMDVKDLAISYIGIPVLGGVQKERSLKISEFWSPTHPPPPFSPFKKSQWNLYKVGTIGAWKKRPLYGDFRFIESSSKNLKSWKVSSKVNQVNYSGERN